MLAELLRSLHAAPPCLQLRHLRCAVLPATTACSDAAAMRKMSITVSYTSAGVGCLETYCLPMPSLIVRANHVWGDGDAGRIGDKCLRLSIPYLRRCGPAFRNLACCSCSCRLWFADHCLRLLAVEAACKLPQRRLSARRGVGEVLTSSCKPSQQDLMC